MPEFRNYEEVRDYLYSLKYHGAKYGIDRMLLLAEALGHPERSYPVIHVAGTNGKGSTCAMLESILRAGGMKTGMYTSPHLVYQGERIQVDRRMLPHDAICDFVGQLKPVAEKLAVSDPDNHPSFFEFMTAMAFLQFARERVDAAIIETGLGGRLDATNVVQPKLCIITSISHDHCDRLGDSLEAIAAEKAGILKAGVPVVVGHLPEAAEAVIRARAEELGCPVHRIADVYSDDPEDCPATNLCGIYQRWNAASAALAAKLLGVEDAHIASGLADVQWSGRWETCALNDDKRIILDSSHNPEGAAMLADNLGRLVAVTGQRPLVIAGTLGSDRAKYLMPVVARFAREIVLVRPHQHRASDWDTLESAIPTSFRGRVRRADIRSLFPFPNFCTEGAPGETLVATGSIYLIGEILEALDHCSRVGEQLLQDTP